MRRRKVLWNPSKSVLREWLVHEIFKQVYPHVKELTFDNVRQYVTAWPTTETALLDLMTDTKRLIAELTPLMVQPGSEEELRSHPSLSRLKNTLNPAVVNFRTAAELCEMDLSHRDTLYDEQFATRYANGALQTARMVVTRFVQKRKSPCPACKINAHDEASCPTCTYEPCQMRGHTEDDCPVFRAYSAPWNVSSALGVKSMTNNSAT
jgi:hypothetical protein